MRTKLTGMSPTQARKHLMAKWTKWLRTMSPDKQAELMLDVQMDSARRFGMVRNGVPMNKSTREQHRAVIEAYAILRSVLRAAAAEGIDSAEVPVYTGTSVKRMAEVLTCYEVLCAMTQCYEA